MQVNDQMDGLGTQSPNSSKTTIESTPVPSHAMSPSGFPLQRIAVIGLLVVVFAGLGYFGYSTWYPQYLVKQFVSGHIKTLRAKDYASAYAQTTAGFKETNTQEDYQKYADVQGLSSSDIPFKIKKAKPFVNEKNLTNHAEVLFELTGDTGQTQMVRMMLIKELGDYKVRLVELPGETNRSSWIGFRYDHEQLEGTNQAESDATPTPAASPQEMMASSAPTAQPQTTTTDPDIKAREWKNVDTLAQSNVLMWEVVATSEIRTSAQVAAEQHLGFIRFATPESMQQAVNQLHPTFKKVETPQTYLNWMQKVGVTNVKDYSVTTGAIEVRKFGSILVAKVEFLMKDFRTTDGSTMPESKKVYVGLVGKLDSNNYIKWQDWQVISLFTGEFIAVNPSFFPF